MPAKRSRSIIILSLLLASTSLFGFKAKRNLVEIEYETCIKHIPLQGDWPHCIKITNRSKHRITVGPLLIGAKLLPYKQAAQLIKLSRKRSGFSAYSTNHWRSMAIFFAF